MNHLIKEARDNKSTPRVHGNGFIQLDITPTTRLHVWGHPDVPRQETDTPIHDHRFTFTSLVLRGCMVNQMYRTMDDALTPTHRLYTAVVRKKEDTVLEPTPHFVRIFPASEQTINVGEWYSMVAGEVHESIVQDLTVTIIMKSGPTLAQGGPSPTVYVPLDIQPDNTFNRYQVPVQDLWKIILEAVK